MSSHVPTNPHSKSFSQDHIPERHIPERKTPDPFWGKNNKSPWKNHAFGKRERLVFTRGKDGSIEAKIISQDLFKRFTNFLDIKFADDSNKPQPDTKYVTEEKIHFDGITETEFNAEKDRIYKSLFYKHNSIKKILTEVEQDIKLLKDAKKLVKEVQKLEPKPKETEKIQDTNKILEEAEKLEIAKPKEAEKIQDTEIPESNELNNKDQKKEELTTPKLPEIEVLETPSIPSPSSVTSIPTSVAFEIAEPSIPVANFTITDKQIEEESSSSESSSSVEEKETPKQDTSTSEDNPADHQPTNGMAAAVLRSQLAEENSIEENYSDFLGDSSSEEELDSPTQQEIDARHKTVETLQNELNNLMAEIKNHENEYDTKIYKKLSASILQIKEKVLTIFKELSSLELNIDKISGEQLQESAKAIHENNLSVSENLAKIRQTFVEESSLPEVMSTQSNLIITFFPGLQETWNQGLQKWQNSAPSSSSSIKDIQSHRTAAFEMIEKINNECKADLEKTIEASIKSLEEGLKKVSNHVTQNQVNLDLAVRKKVWERLHGEGMEIGNNLSRICEWKKAILYEKAVDDQLIKIFNTEEGFTAKIISGLSFLAKPFKAIFFSQPEYVIARENQDEKATFHATKAMENVNQAILSFLNAMPASHQAEKTALEKQHRSHLNNKTLNRSELENFLQSLQNFYEKNSEAREKLNPSLTILQTNKDVLFSIIAGRLQNNENFIKQIKEKFPLTFSKRMHDGIKNTGKTAIAEIKDVKEINLLKISKTWEENRLLAKAKIEMLDSLEWFATTYDDYSKKAQDYEKKAADITGPEKILWQESLNFLSEALENLGDSVKDTDFNGKYGKITGSIKQNQDKLYTRMVFANTRLMHAIAPFEPLLKIENDKKEVRKKLRQEIDSFIATIKLYDEPIKDIEEHYIFELEEIKDFLPMPIKKFELKETRDSLAASIKKFEKFKTSHFVTESQSILPGKSFFSWQSPAYLKNPSIDDLNLDDLTNFAKQVSQEIVIEKSKISQKQIKETAALVTTFSQNYEDLERQLPELVKAAGNSPDKKMPPKLTENKKMLPKLQFFKATNIRDQLNAMKAAHATNFSANPSVTLIHQTLTRDIPTLKSISSNLQNNDLSLLVQIQSLDKTPLVQRQAKLAFIATLTTKMANHTKAMTEQLDQFKYSAAIENEVKKIINNAGKNFFTAINSLPKALLQHAKEWKQFSEVDDDDFSGKINVEDLPQLSFKELQSYAAAIDHAIATAAANMETIKIVQAKVQISERIYAEKLASANKTMEILDKSNQFLLNEDLKSFIDNSEAKKTAIANNTTLPQEIVPPPKVIVTKGWLWNSTTTQPAPLKKIKSTDNAVAMLYLYNSELGKLNTQIEATLRLFNKNNNHLSTIDQLEKLQKAKNPPTAMENALIQKYQAEIGSQTEGMRKRLDNYLLDLQKSSQFTRYFPKDSDLYKKISKAIEDKLTALEKIEKGYETTTIQGFSLRNLGDWYRGKTETTYTPLSNLNVKEMRDYQNRLKKIQSSIDDEINHIYFFDTLKELQSSLEKITSTQIPEITLKLKQAGLITESYDFQANMYALASVEDDFYYNFQNNTYTVKTPADLTTVVNALKINLHDLYQALKNVDLDKRPPSHLQQLKKLLEMKVQSKKVNPTVLADIERVKSNIIEDIEKNLGNHQNDIQGLKSDIAELYDTYNIRISSKKAVMDAIEKENELFAIENLDFEDGSSRPRLGRFANYLSDTLPRRSDIPVVGTILYYTPLVNRIPGPHSVLDFLSERNPTVQSTIHITEMTAERILQLNPEKTISDKISLSNKKITALFNYKLIQESHNNYKEILQEAEALCKKLKENGQLYHASTLNDEIQKVKAGISKAPISNDAQLEKLANELKAFTAQLERANSKALTSKEMTAKEQYEKFMIPLNNPLTAASISKTDKQNIENNVAKLTQHLLPNIIESVSKKKTVVSESKKDLKNISDKLTGFPIAWKTAINQDLDKSKNKIEKAGSGLTVETEEVVGYPGFRKTIIIPELIPLHELDVKGLLDVDANIAKEVKILNNNVDKYQLKTLTAQLKTYTKYLKNIEDLKTKWTKEKQTNSVNQLNTLINDHRAALTNYFANAEATNDSIPVQMEKLVKAVDSLTAKLIQGTEETTRNKPDSIGPEILKLIDPITKQVKAGEQAKLDRLRADYQEELKTKLKTEKQAIGDYLSKMDKIDALIKDIRGQGCSESLKRLVKAKFKEKQNYLTMLEEKGFPSITDQGISWTPFNQLTPETLVLEYGTLISRLTNDEENNSTSLLSALEKEFRFKEVKENLENYKTAKKQAIQANAQHDIKATKAQQLNYALTATKNLFNSAIENLDSTAAISLFRSTIDHAQGSLRTILTIDIEDICRKDNGHFNIDPWVALAMNVEVENVNQVLFHNDPNRQLKLFYAANNSYQEVNADQSFTVSSFNILINNKIEELDGYKIELDKILINLNQLGLDKSPTYQAILQFINLLNNQQESPIRMLENLKAGFPSTDQSGNQILIKQENLKDFDQILEYKKLTDATLSKVSGIKEAFASSEMIFWNDCLNQVKATKEIVKPSRLPEYGISQILRPLPALIIPVAPISAVVAPAGAGVAVPQQVQGGAIVPPQGQPAANRPQKVLVNPAVSDQALVEDTRKVNELAEQLKVGLNTKGKNINHTINNLNAHVIKSISNAPFRKSLNKIFTDLTTLLKKGVLLENLSNQAKEFKRNYDEHMQVLNLDQTFTLQLNQSYLRFIFPLTNKKYDQLTLQEIITDLNRYANAAGISNKFIEIVNEVKQANDLIEAAKSTVHKLGPRGALYQQNINALKNEIIALIDIKENDDLDAVKTSLTKVVKSLSTINAFNEKKLNILTDIRNFYKKTKADWEYLNDMFENKLPLLEGKFSEKIKSLKANYPINLMKNKKVADLNEEETKGYQKYVENTIIALSNEMGIKKAKEATEAFNEHIIEVKKLIKNHLRKNENDSAAKLQLLIDSAKETLVKFIKEDQGADYISHPFNYTEFIKAIKEETEKLNIQSSAVIPNIRAPQDPLKQLDILRQPIINDFQQTTVKIIESCESLKVQANDIVTKLKGNIRTTFIAELNQLLDGFATDSQNLVSYFEDSSGLISVKIPVTELTSQIFKIYKEQTPGKLEKIQENIKSIQNILKILKNSKENMEIMQSQKRSELTKFQAQVPINYFYVDRIKSHMENLDSIQQQRLYVFDSIENVKTATAQFESALKYTELMFKKASSQKDAMNEVEQLIANERENFLQKESLAAIRGNLASYADQEINIAVRTLNNHKAMISSFPQNWQGRFNEVMDGHLTEINALKKDEDGIKALILNSEDLKTWLKAVKSLKTRIETLQSSYNVPVIKQQVEQYKKFINQMTFFTPHLLPGSATLLDSKKSEAIRAFDALDAGVPITRFEHSLKQINLLLTKALSGPINEIERKHKNHIQIHNNALEDAFESIAKIMEGNDSDLARIKNHIRNQKIAIDALNFINSSPSISTLSEKKFKKWIDMSDQLYGAFSSFVEAIMIPLDILEGRIQDYNELMKDNRITEPIKTKWEQSCKDNLKMIKTFDDIVNCTKSLSVVCENIKQAIDALPPR